MGAGKSGHIQPSSASHLCLFLESAAGRELRTREVKGRLGLRSQPAGQDGRWCAGRQAMGCWAGEHRAGQPGAWETWGLEKLRPGNSGSRGLKGWGLLRLGLPDGNPESGTIRVCFSAMASPFREPWGGSEPKHPVPGSLGLGSSRHRRPAPQPPYVLTSLGCGNREVAYEWTAAWLCRQVAPRAWAFIQDRRRFLSPTAALDRNSTQGVPADILEPERLGLEEEVKG